MKRAFLVALAVALSVAPATALADAPDVARAKEAFAAGAKAYREARYKDAIDLFLKANELDAHAELIFNVGQAYEKLGDVPHALRSYREYLRLAPGVADRATIEASIKNLEARLRERGVQQVSVFSTPAGATLMLDDKIVGQTPWTGEIAPGKHVAVLRATGYPDTAKEFVLLADRAMDLDIALSATRGAGATAIVPKPGEAPAAPPAPPPDAPKQMKVAPWTIAALAVGVGGLGASLGLEIARRGAESDAMADPTQVGYRDRYDAMVTRQTAARVLVGIGAAATVAGGVLLVLDLRSASKGQDTGSRAPARAAFGCAGSTCGAFVAGRF
jgi:tetratricopeptide (TPR) repeat protein